MAVDEDAVAGPDAPEAVGWRQPSGAGRPCRRDAALGAPGGRDLDHLLLADEMAQVIEGGGI
ncbi:MAG TPA: hypothetical protein VG476_00135 [Acidimicrobiales bacterium]|nr:hypothetical protein [Acidimicrobiales bacterium]